jgi:hypothetical protein
LSRKYVLEILGITAVYCAVVVAAMLWLKSRQPHAPWKYLIAGLPVLPALLYPAAILSYFHNVDELQQKIYMESFAFGFLMTAILTLAYGFMETAGLPRLSWIHIWPLMAVCWAIGLVVANVRYK